MKPLGRLHSHRLRQKPFFHPQFIIVARGQEHSDVRRPLAHAINKRQHAAYRRRPGYSDRRGDEEPSSSRRMSASRYTSQNPRQFLSRVRLLQQLEPVPPFLGQHMAVARGQDDRQVWIAPTDLLTELDAAHARHDHIGKDDVEIVRSLQKREGLGGIGGPSRLVAEILEDLRRETPHLDVVLHHEHPTSTPLLRSRAGGNVARVPSSGCFVDAW